MTSALHQSGRNGKTSAAPKDLMKGSRAKVTISIPNHYIDHTIVVGLQAAHVVAYLIPKLISSTSEYPEAQEFLRCPTAAWHLEKFGGEAISPSATLSDAGVKNGDTLYLVPTEPGEKFQEIIDDPAMALGYHQKKNFPGWSSVVSKKMALTSLQLTAGIVSAVMMIWMSTRDIPVMTRMAAVATFAAAALLYLVIAVIAGHSDDPLRAAISGPFSIVAYLAGSAAAFIAIPRSVSIYQFMVAGCAILVMSLVIGALSDKNPAIHYAAATGSIMLAVVGGIYMVYPTSPMVFGAQLAVFGFAVSLISPRLSMSFARFYIPWVPTNGENHVDKQVRDMAYTSETESQSAIGSVMSQESKIIASHGIIDGILSGTLGIIVSGMFVMGLFGGYRPWIVWALAFILAAVMVSRGSAFDDAKQRILMTSAGAGGVIMFLAGMSLSSTDTDTGPRLFAGLITISLAVTFATVVSLQQRQFLSPIALGWAEKVEHILYATIIPLLIIFVMDMASKVRNR